MTSANYVRSFGIQWNHFYRTQLDRLNGTTISRDRLFDAIGSQSGLDGELILEAGCGAGRFTQALLDAGARVVSFDLSTAIWANLKNNGDHSHLMLLQADIYAIPFKTGQFDKVVCLGVLQHCPNVEDAFKSLVPFVKPGGELVIDINDIEQKKPQVNPDYQIRKVTRRLPPKLLFLLVRATVPFLLPVRRVLRRTNYLRRFYKWIPIRDYQGIKPLNEKQINEWAVLDTFDLLASYYSEPQHIEDVRRWFVESELDILDLRKGGNGIIGRGRCVSP